MKLWVDDCKPAPEGWAVARTYKDAIRLLTKFEYDEVALDHDLGDEKSPTGYDILCAIEAGTVKRPGWVTIISFNPVGRQKMQVVVQRLYGGGAGAR